MEIGWKIGDLDHVFFGESAGAFDGVFQFANVAGPIVRGQRFHGLAGDLKWLAAAGVHFVFQEMRDDERDIFGAFFERRNLDGNDVKAIIKVFAEGAFFDSFFERLVGGGKDADVDGDGDVVADAADFFFLEDAQEAALQKRRHGADFIEENGSAVGFLEEALLVVHSAGESAFAMAEEFGFEKIFRECAAVNGDERGVAA